ncbi:MAG TPA: hypothetical protein VFB45_09165 [Pseudolabrys sp.]|nr:hypothetical protein [Pseudolabrys sp.]
MSLLEASAPAQRRDAGSIADRFCVFVASSDRAHDIFEIVFQGSDTIWRGCDWPRFVSFTSQHPDIYGFKALAAKSKSDWRGELGQQIDALPANIEYVLLLVEDTLFMSPIDAAKLNAIAERMLREKIAYVRLVRVWRTLPGRVVEYVRRKLSKDQLLRPLSFSEPYYSSVEFAIWRRDYLRELLRLPGSVWEFEHLVTEERHYALWEDIVEQHQIVSRGKWNRNAPGLLARRGLSLAGSPREFQTSQRFLRGLKERISFQLFGFLPYRIRRLLNRLPKS